ncbi:hypothetical protein NMY22_g11886 [Coprinellus aureogranulatus]|nr:hypothetical protein NMY22_g11886 [Coprinellus aureogranulatus]
MPKRTIKERFKRAGRAAARLLLCRPSPPPSPRLPHQPEIPYGDVNEIMEQQAPFDARRPEDPLPLDEGIGHSVGVSPRRTAEGPSRESVPLEQQVVLEVSEPEGTPLPDSGVEHNYDAVSKQPEEDLSKTLTHDIVAPSSPTETSEGVPDEDDERDIVSEEPPSTTVQPPAAYDVASAKEEPNVSPEPAPSSTGPLPDSKPKVSQDKPTWLVALKSTLGFVERVSDVFPPLKSTVAGINAIVEAADDFFGNQDEFVKLSERVRLLDEILRGRSDSSLPQDVRDRRDGLARAVDDLGKQLLGKITRDKWKRAVFAKEDQQDVIRIIREINFAIEYAMLDVTITSEALVLRTVEGIDWLKERSIEESRILREGISGIAKGVANLNKAEQLKRLGNIEGFEFGNKGQRGQCVPGSRVALLAQLLAWAESKDSNHAFWLDGIAGTGKTAVAETLCSQLSDRGLLGASFFCSIKVQDLSDVHHIIPSLAKTLAATHPTFGDALSNILESQSKNPIGQMTLAQQYDLLILRPAAVAFKDYDKNIILCADALDECRNTTALKDFLESILSKKPAAPIKIFFTSRPELTIKREVEHSTHSSHMLRLHDIEEDIVRADIELYVSQQLKKVPELKDEYGNSWPPPEVEKIVEQSDGLFIVAATIVRDICSETGNPVERLRARGRVPKLSGIYELYWQVMERAIVGLELPEKKDLRACLSLLVVALRPLSLGEYAVLLGRPVSTIQATFKMLHSVVQFPTNRDNGMPISIHHASFVDFLTLPGPATRTPGNVNASPLCLRMHIMGEPCTWKGLYWLEALSVVNKVGYSSILWELSREMTLEALKVLLVAIRDFAQMFATPISHSAPHIYLSALPFYQAALGQSEWWSPHIPSIPTVHLTTNAKENKGRILANLSGTGSRPWVLCLAISPDGSKLISGGNSGVVRMWNTHSGEPVTGSMGGHLDDVNSVAFSPDGSKVISGSDDLTIRVWDTETGQPVGSAIEGHENWVYSVAFSPDGSKIVSGSKDETIRIWDTLSGDAIGDPLEGHTGAVFTVAFSPDGTKIVSGCDDGAIRMWDAQNGQQLLEPLKGHSEAIASVAFSPNGSRIVSGSLDKTIRIWDAHSGQDIFGPIEGHLRDVTSVAFSPDSSKIVSGSKDKTIRVWDAQSGQLVGSTMEGHSSIVRAVTFTPDGLRIISGSYDGTIRSWDLQGDHIAGDPGQCHSDLIGSVAYSRDGSMLVSGSWDKTVQVWDAKTGQALVEPMKGHSEGVTSVTFSPDGSKIVSGSYDKTIQVWDAKSGVIVLGPLQGHYQGVSSVVFSPDGSLIASGSDDWAIRLWDAKTGQPFLDPLKAHGNSITSIAFSSCGARLVSGSKDNTIRVWDSLSGQTVLGPLHSHHGAICSVAFSPDNSKIFSVCHDETIQAWDAHDGRVLLGPLGGHPHSVRSVAFSPDGLKIASGSTDKTIHIWDAQSGDLINTLQGHSDYVRSVCFSPDGSRIASGSNDKTIRVWNPEQPGISKPLFLHHYPAASFVMDEDGWIRNASKDLLLWVPPQFRPSICLPPLEYIIGPSTKVELSHATYHGPNWKRCSEPSEPHADCPWPHAGQRFPESTSPDV